MKTANHLSFLEIKFIFVANEFFLILFLLVLTSLVLNVKEDLLLTYIKADLNFKYFTRCVESDYLGQIYSKLMFFIAFLCLCFPAI